jgi:hypothetical protein
MVLSPLCENGTGGSYLDCSEITTMSDFGSCRGGGRTTSKTPFVGIANYRSGAMEKRIPRGLLWL